MEVEMKKMYGNILVILVVAAFLIIVSCSSNSTDPVEQDNNPNNWALVGTWVGTGFEFVSQADTSVKADLTTYGVAYSIIINHDSTYSSTTAFLGQNMVETGNVIVTATEITISPVNGVSHSGNYTQTATGFDIVITDEGFDFDQDGTDEPAFLYIELVKP